jgi:hypothetical protein
LSSAYRFVTRTLEPGGGGIDVPQQHVDRRVRDLEQAGTTEIAILADKTADPMHAVAALISQAEHDPNAASIPVTPSVELTDAVDAELRTQVATTRRATRIYTQAIHEGGKLSTVVARRGKPGTLPSDVPPRTFRPADRPGMLQDRCAPPSRGAPVRAQDKGNERDGGTGRAMPRPQSAQVPRWAAGVLSLQRSAGNLAVSRAVEEDRHRTWARLRPHGPHRPAQSSVHDAIASSGRPLEPRIRERAEQAYGMDLGHVRVHSDPVAQRSAQELGAVAYTTGAHIVCGRRNLDDETAYHEIDHVCQQAMGPVAGTDNGTGTKVSGVNDPFEVQAAANGRRMAQGGMPDLALPGSAASGGAEHTSGNSTHDGPSVQRTPAAWADSNEVEAVRRQKRGMAFQSRWPGVVSAVQRYGSLQTSDLPGRRTGLREIENAIETWRTNQGQGFVLDKAASAAKRNAIDGLEGLMSREYAEIQQLSQPSAPVAVAAPMAIPGARHASPAASTDDGSSASTTPGLSGARITELWKKLRDAAPLPPDVIIDVHFTTDENISDIHRTGLRPSRGRGGIGLPDNQEPDRYNFYVLTGSNPDTTSMVHQDSGGERAVAVLRVNGVVFDPDRNYPRGGAARYSGEAPPARRAGATEGNGPFSFALPLRPGRTLDQVTALINRCRRPEEQQLTAEEVITRIHGHLLRKFGLSMGEHLA